MMVVARCGTTRKIPGASWSKIFNGSRTCLVILRLRPPTAVVIVTPVTGKTDKVELFFFSRVKNSSEIAEMDAPESSRAELDTSKILIWISGRCATCIGKSFDFDVDELHERLFWHSTRTAETCEALTRFPGHSSDAHVQLSELVVKTCLVENDCF